jgi:hypothetical protein
LIYKGFFRITGGQASSLSTPVTRMYAGFP